MPEKHSTYDVRREAARLGGLSSYGRTPDPAAELFARRQLATARLDREIRNMMRADVALDDVHAAHIVGLLLSSCGVRGEATTHIESVIRAAVVAAQTEGA